MADPDAKIIGPIKDAVAKAIKATQSSPEGQADVLETLCASLSLMIATMGRGHPVLMNELAEGASQYVFDRSTGFQKFGAFMAAVHKDTPNGT